MSLRLLLIDDSEEESSTIRDQATAGLEVTWTREAVEACRILAERTWDLILLDLTLPDEWGLDGLVRISTVAPDTPVLALGMPGDEELGRHAVVAGAAGFVMKQEMTGKTIEPIVNETLRDHLIDVTDEYRRRDGETGFYDREAFLLQARRRMRLAGAAGKGVLLFTARMKESASDHASHDADRIASAAAVMRLTFRRADLLGRIGDHQFAAIGLVHPSDDSDVIVSQRLDEVVQSRNATVDHDNPIELEWQVDRLDPELSGEELEARIEQMGGG